MRYRLVAAAALIGFTVAGCETREQSGTAIGAVAGGLIGSQFGGGPGERLAAGLAGAAIGGLIGNAIGRDLDEQDRRRAYAAEQVVWVEGRRSEWRSEKAYGYVEPGRTYYRGANYCREYTHTIYINGRPQTAVGTACRNPDGSWSPVG
ncbi:MAG: glycine zipper 2TM domain-containing protein [Proteobacteria bacterium]|jgi:surface antigen|nr:glycine zipper 2TM domain-containing protein [Pseudomonadota bacterium]